MAKRKNRRHSREPELVRRDGALCATFVNTANARRKAITSYADLLAWGEQCGVLSSPDVRRLGRVADERPDDAELVYQRALRLRALLESILLTLVAQETVSTADLDALNADLATVFSRRRLVLAVSGYRWGWDDRGDDDLDRMLWPVIVSVADVLTSKYHRKVRRCPGEDCGLVFVDRTPGSPKKWCDTRTCGHRRNALKSYHRRMKRQRERKRARKAENG